MKPVQFLFSFGLMLGFAVSANADLAIHREGLVEFAGAQSTIFETGKADGVVPLADMSAGAASFGVGAVAGLDGEITVLNGIPYVTKVRGGTYLLDRDPNQSAIFAVWTKQDNWTEQQILSNVITYEDLQRFVKDRAIAAGIDTNQPFPFLLTGMPAEVRWHINVDRSEGSRIDNRLFAKSKESFVARNETMDIVGFYSENHSGVFISVLAPGLKDKNMKNAIHIHLVTRDGLSAGHIDDIALSPGMKLLLPVPGKR